MLRVEARHRGSARCTLDVELERRRGRVPRARRARREPARRASCAWPPGCCARSAAASRPTARPGSTPTRGVDVPPERRRCGYVFQDYALFPHLSAWQNVAYPLRGLPRGERRARALDAARPLRAGASRADAAAAARSSGGERQRVAVARALAREPERAAARRAAVRARRPHPRRRGARARRRAARGRGARAARDARLRRGGAARRPRRGDRRRAAWSRRARRASSRPRRARPSWPTSPARSC